MTTLNYSPTVADVKNTIALFEKVWKNRVCNDSDTFCTTVGKWQVEFLPYESSMYRGFYIVKYGFATSHELLVLCWMKWGHKELDDLYTNFIKRHAFAAEFTSDKNYMSDEQLIKAIERVTGGPFNDEK